MLHLDGSIVDEKQPFRHIAEYPGMYVFGGGAQEIVPAHNPVEAADKLLFIGGVGVTLGSEYAPGASEVPGVGNALSGIFGKDNEAVTGDALERVKLVLMESFVEQVEPVQAEEDPFLHALAREVYGSMARRNFGRGPIAPSGIVIIGGQDNLQAETMYSRDLENTTKSRVRLFFDAVRRKDWGFYNNAREYIPLAEYVCEQVKQEQTDGRIISDPTALINKYSHRIMPSISAQFMPNHERLGEALQIS